MDWTPFLTQAADLSLFELGRLSRAIYELSVDPDHIDKARARLKPGMEVHYFDEQTKRMVPARVLRLNRTCALLEQLDNGERWSVHYRDIQTADIPAPVLPATTPKSEWKVGDLVGFKDRQNRDLIGRIEKLNARTASIIVKTGERWRVAYGVLFPVHEMAATEETTSPSVSRQGVPYLSYDADDLDDAERTLGAESGPSSQQ